MKLDRIDVAILKALQTEGRLTNKLLAKRIGLSASACFDRVRRLEREGYIVGFRAIVDLARLGARFEAWGEIVLAEHSSEAIASFSRVVDQTPTIISAYHVTGPHDFLLHIAAHRINAWEDFLSNLALSDIKVGAARLSVVMDRIKARSPILPLSPPDE